MKQITRILVSISILLFLFQIDGVFAKGELTAEKGQNVTDAAIEILNFLIGIFSFLISPLIALAGWLLSPDWTMGDIFGLRGMLHKFWVTISNVTYFIYAIALIIMALASMFNVENYGVKKLLPRFALGILMVPMTWWFVQATVSLANILTVSIVQIPFDALKGMQTVGGNGWYDKEKVIPMEITYDETIAGTGSKFTASDCSKESGKCITIEKMMTEGTSGPFSMLNAYGYGIFRIQDIKIIGKDTGMAQIKGGVNIVNKLFYGAIVFLAFSIIIIALIAALFKRAILLWVYAMFSPLFSLAFFLPDGLKKGLDLFDYKKFIGLAFVPVYAAGALSFGLVIINLIINPIESSNQCAGGTGGEYCLKNIMGDNKSTLTAKKGKTEDGTETVESTWELGSIKLKHKGKINKETTTGNTPLTDSIFGTIIFDILGILILWTAVIGALKGSELTASIVGKVADFGKDLGKYAPLPIPGGSYSGMKEGMTKIRNMPRTAADERFKQSNFGKAVQEAEQRYSGKTVDNIKANEQMKDISRTLKGGILVDDPNAEKGFSSIRNAIGSGIKSFGDGYKAILEKLDTDSTSKQLAKYTDKLGSDMDADKIKKILEQHKKGENINSVEGMKIISALGAIEKGGKLNGDLYDNNLDKLRNGSTNQNQSTTNQQPNNPPKSGNNLTININGTHIEIPEDSNGGITSAGINNVSDEINKNYKGNIDDLKTFLIQQGMKENDADAIVKKVKEKKEGR